MKVVVDEELCEANAVCMKLCPEVFRVGEDDRLTLLVDEVPEKAREAALEAVERCPRQALCLE